MDHTTLHRKIEKLQLRVDTLTAELDRVAALSASNEKEAERYKKLYEEAKELLSVAECGASVYVDVQKRGEWKSKKEALIS